MLSFVKVDTLLVHRSREQPLLMELADGNQNAVGEFESEYDVEEIEEEVEEYEEVDDEEEEMGGRDGGVGRSEGEGVGDRRAISPRKRSENVDNSGEEMKQADAGSSSAGLVFWSLEFRYTIFRSTWTSISCLFVLCLIG